MEKKSADWIVATLECGGNVTKDVSINRNDKKTGAVAFPTFDEIQSGRTVEGELWNSPAGKWYLFAPKASKSGGNGAFRQKQIEDTMEKKAVYIGQAQGNKELGIKVSSTMRMAVDLVVAEGLEGRVEDGIKNAIQEWRAWLWMEWDKEDKDFPPFK